MQYDSFNYRYWSRIDLGFPGIPEVNYVEMFVSVRGGPYSTPGFQGLNDGWWSLKPGQALWATAGHPEDALGAGKKAGKSLNGQLAVASPLETIVTLLKANVGLVVTAGTIKFKGYRVRYPQIPDPSRKSGQSDARGHVASVDVVLS